MTTFDEHSRDEVFRDYLNEARAAKDYASDAGDVVGPELTGYYIGRGQIHATLAHAAATLLAAMPETGSPAACDCEAGDCPADLQSPDGALTPRCVMTSGHMGAHVWGPIEALVAERDALRDRVDELAAAGLTPTMQMPPEGMAEGIRDAFASVADQIREAIREPVQLTLEEYGQGVRDMPSGVKDKLQEMGEQIRKAFVSISEVATTPPSKHEPGTEPLCTCGHHSDQHLAVTLPEGDFVLPCELCDCERYTPAPPSRTPLCTCGHHFDRHYPSAAIHRDCRDCPCTAYTPNTTEVDGWSEPDARGARFRVARFEQASHTPPVYFKVTDQLGLMATKELPTEATAQRYADYANRTFGSTGTEASVETEADPWTAPIKGNVEVRPAAPQPESPAEALVTAAEGALLGHRASDTRYQARVATIAVLRALADLRYVVSATEPESIYTANLRRLANEVGHTDTPTTE